ncbi:hypothetical protein ABEW34_21665 [Paenibacillus algorifonticola]|uniref:hypothetical protein n=1 Tax=Paenibacillus algorifonticola TaxID=684063 RepID=UPI003D27CB27
MAIIILEPIFTSIIWPACIMLVSAGVGLYAARYGAKTSLKFQQSEQLKSEQIQREKILKNMRMELKLNLEYFKTSKKYYFNSFRSGDVFMQSSLFPYEEFEELIEKILEVHREFDKLQVALNVNQQIAAADAANKLKSPIMSSIKLALSPESMESSLKVMEVAMLDTVNNMMPKLKDALEVVEREIVKLSPVK